MALTRLVETRNGDDAHRLLRQRVAAIASLHSVGGHADDLLQDVWVALLEKLQSNKLHIDIARQTTTVIANKAKAIANRRSRALETHVELDESVLPDVDYDKECQKYEPLVESLIALKQTNPRQYNAVLLAAKHEVDGEKLDAACMEWRREHGEDITIANFRKLRSRGRIALASLMIERHE